MNFTRGSVTREVARRKNATPSRSTCAAMRSASPLGGCAFEGGRLLAGTGGRAYWGWVMKIWHSDRSDAHAELFLRDLRHRLWRPRRVPHDLYLRLLHAGERLDLPLHVRGEIRGRGAARGGERHLDHDPRVTDVDVVHESEVVNVDRDLRVVALLQHRDDVVLAHGHGSFSGGIRRPSLITFGSRLQRTIGLRPGNPASSVCQNPTSCSPPCQHRYTSSPFTYP